MTLQILDFSLYTFLLSILVICVVTCYYMIEYGLEAFAPTDFILLYLYYPFILFVACGTFVVIFSFNRLVPQGQDFFDSKLCRRADFRKKVAGRKKDKARHEHDQEIKLKASNERKRSLGRRLKEAADQVAKELVPEGHDSLLHEDPSDPEPSEWSRYDSMKTGLHQTFTDAFDSVLCRFDEHEDMPTDMIASACIKLMGFLGPLFTCTTSADIARVVIAAASQHVSPSCIATIRRFISQAPEDGETLIPEGSTFAGIDVEKVLTGLRDSTVQMRFLPMTKAIVSTMMLMIVSGMRPSSALTDGKMSAILTVWEDKILATLSFKNLSDCVAEIFDFSVHIVRAIKNGESIRNLILPNTLHKQFAVAIPMEQVMLDNSLEETYGVTIEAFAATVDELLENMEYALAKSKSAHERTIYTRYCIDLRRLAKRIGNFIKNHSFKEEPYMVSLYGGSGLGKSGLVQIMINTYCQVVGHTVPDSRITYVGGISNFDDGVTNATEIVVADDIANIVPSEAERNQSFLAQIIRIGNNTPAMTRQAELTMKAQHYWRNRLTIATTNVPNILAHKISNRPITMLRRFEHAEVFVDPKYAIEASGAIDVSKVGHVQGSAGEILAPMHLVQLFHWEESGPNHQCKRVNDGPVITFPEYLKYYANQIQIKHTRQTRYIGNLARMKITEHCPECFAPKAFGWCKHVTEDVVPESAAMLSHLATSGLHESMYWLTNLVLRFNLPSLFPTLEAFLGLVALTGLAFIIGGNHIQFGTTEMRALWYLIGFLSLSAIVFYLSFAWSFEMGLFVWTLWLLVSVVLGSIGIARAIFRHVTEDIRRRCRPNIDVNPILRGVAYLSSIIVIIKVCLSMRGMFENRGIKAEGNLQPKSLEEIESRNKEGSEWDRATIQKAAPFGRPMTMTKTQALSRMASCVWRFRMESGWQKSIGSVFFISSQLSIIAGHSWEKMQEMDLEKAKIYFWKKADQLGEQFSTHIVKNVDILINGKKSDHVLLKLSSGPMMPQVVDFFPEHRNHKCAFSMVFRDEDGNLTFPHSKYNNGVYSVKGLCGSWSGSKHTLSSPSAAGNCSSPAISWDKPHSIVGLHSAGSGVGNTGVTFCPIRSEIEAAVEKMRFASMSPEGLDIYPTALTESPNLGPYGEIKATLNPEAPEKAAVNWCPENGKTLTTFFGDDPHARITPSSSIRDSIMKPLLAKAGCNVNYGPPRFNSNRTHSTYLNIRRTAMTDIPLDIMEMAVRDYLDPIVEEIRELGISKKSFLPLSEVLNGKKGERFIGPIKEETSAGFGLKGAKERYLDISYDEKDGSKWFDAHPEIVERFENMMAQYRRGRTNGMVLRSALKDEAVEYSPETNAPLKVDRLFMSCGMADVFCQKSMIAPVAQVMQSLPLLTELAVGINSTTGEWDQIYQHIIAWNPDGVLEGDFSKYDVRLSGQLMRAVFYIILIIARELGYSVEELSAMEAMFQEVVMNYRLFGGSLIAIDGWMSSGVWPTIFANGIGNAIVHRCCFYNLKKKGKFVFPRYSAGVSMFRAIIRAIFQGDDSLSASRSKHFNMRVMKEFCDKYGMAYTAGDKKSEIQDYVPPGSAKFCKRGFFYHPKVEMRVGNLAVESLIKSLCTYTSSVASEETVLTETMDSNLRELARHPVETFEKYRQIFDDVATELGIRSLVKYIDRSYDEWWEILGPIYRGEVEATPFWNEPEILSLDELMDA
jgi:hypothetical protein